MLYYERNLYAARKYNSWTSYSEQNKPDHSKQWSASVFVILTVMGNARSGLLRFKKAQHPLLWSVAHQSLIHVHIHRRHAERQSSTWWCEGVTGVWSPIATLSMVALEKWAELCVLARGYADCTEWEIKVVSLNWRLLISLICPLSWNYNKERCMDELRQEQLRVQRSADRPPPHHWKVLEVCVFWIMFKWNSIV